MQEFDLLTSLPAIAPEIGLTILAVVVLALDLYLPESQRKNVSYVAAFGMAALAITPLIWSPDTNGLYWGGMVRHDILAQVFKVMVLLAGSITCLIAIESDEVGNRGEFYLVVIVSTLGASLMAASADLIMVFVALETTSIPLYMLAAFGSRDDQRSIESGVKYFLFGSFASAIMLYGFSLIYGFSGQTNLYEIAGFLAAGDYGGNAVPVLVSLVLVFVGFGFKISAVPFHFWTPDVYEGAPTPVTAFVSVASKAASMALLMRFLVAVFPETLMIEGREIHAFWIQLVAAVAVISMTLGNVVALAQTNIKRLLAYSSIAQAGYTLIGVAAIQTQAGVELADTAAAQGVAAVAFYMFMYTFTNLLAFAIVVIFSARTGSETIADLAGLSRRNPWMALTMTIALLSLAGIPPAAGFFGKFFLFNAAVKANLEWLAIIGVLNAIIALYYYLMVIKIMYVDRSEDDDKPIPLSVTSSWVIGLTTVAVLLLGVIPTQIFDWAVDGAEALLAFVL